MRLFPDKLVAQICNPKVDPGLVPVLAVSPIKRDDDINSAFVAHACAPLTYPVSVLTDLGDVPVANKIPSFFALGNVHTELVAGDIVIPTVDAGIGAVHNWTDSEPVFNNEILYLNPRAQPGNCFQNC